MPLAKTSTCPLCDRIVVPYGDLKDTRLETVRRGSPDRLLDLTHRYFESSWIDNIRIEAKEQGSIGWADVDHTRDRHLCQRVTHGHRREVGFKGHRLGDLHV